MKKIIIVSAFILPILLSSCSVLTPKFTHGQYSYATMKNGYWNDWSYTSIGLNKIEFFSAGNIDHFILYSNYTHPSQYGVKVYYNLDSERREDKWYVYNATVEYYTTTQSDKFYFDYWPMYWPFGAVNGKGFKNVSSAVVKIDRSAKKAHRGATFNIFFDNSAIGICGVN